MKILTLITLMLIVSVSAMAQSTIKWSNQTGTLKVGVDAPTKSKADTSKSYFNINTLPTTSCSGCNLLTLQNNHDYSGGLGLYNNNSITFMSTNTLLTIKSIENSPDYHKGAIIAVRKSQTEWLNDSTLVIHPVIK